jgi:hypothetical protein
MPLTNQRYLAGFTVSVKLERRCTWKRKKNTRSVAGLADITGRATEKTGSEKRSEAAIDLPRFVYLVQTKLLRLYNEMAGPEAEERKTDFVVDIRKCLNCFYWEKTWHGWECKQVEAEKGEEIDW